MARVVKWAAGIAAALLLLIVVVVAGLDTGPGRRFLVGRLGGYETASGISIRADRIDGSIYGRMTIVGLRVNDAQGAFLAAPRVDVDWRPFAYARGHIDVRSAAAPLMTLLRRPALKPTPPDPQAPLLPDIDLTLGRLRIDRFVIAPPVDGKRHIVRIAGAAAIADGRAQISADAGAVAAPGVAGGDVLRLRLDAVPRANRLMVDVKLDAPAGGLVDGYAGLGKRLTLALDGRGDWANWRGALKASAGATPLADVALAGANGVFDLKGRALPNAVLAAGAATRLAAPAVDLEGRVTLGQRNAEVRLLAHSAALAVEAQGLVNLANNSFGKFRIDAQLLTPGAIAPAARGRDVRLAAVLDGPFATPAIDYRLTAATLGFNATTIEGLEASGRATIDAARILVPVHGRIARVSGLNAAAGGLLTNVAIDGSMAYAGGKLLSDGLRLRSRALDATAILIADLANGRYTGALKGRVNDYQVNGIGRVNLLADAKLVPGANGGFGIAGWVRATTRHLDNSAVRDFLGGNALVTARVAYSAGGVASVQDLRVAAPAFRLAGGEGRYAPDGRIAFRAAGSSAAYGPITLLASGTVDRPNVRLHAARPGLGLAFADVDAELIGTGGGAYLVHARGSSAYGPFAGDFAIGTAKGPLRIDVRSARFAGVDIRGTVSATSAGPYVGTLSLAGSGLAGQLRLGAAGRVQRADIDLAAQAARLPGAAGLTIGSGTIKATALLYPGAPSLSADVALGNIVQGPLVLTSLRAGVRYQNRAGSVALVAAGHSQVPFDVAAQAQLSPDRVLVNARGHANGIAFRLAQPATILRAGANWTLAPATVVLPQGSVRLSGSYGARTAFHAELDGVDLSITQAALPRLRLGGKASGALDYASAGAATPTARARIDIAGFTRTGALVVSDPIDVALLATLGPGGADLGALIRRGGATVGRIKARVGPVAAGAGWAGRLATAPLAGGIRYAGPAELLWTLTGIAGQEVSGPIAIGADFGGRVDAPTVTGLIRATQLRYENETYGTVISNIALEGRFTRSELLLQRFSGKAGGGTIVAQGAIGLDAARGYPINLTATLDDAQLARSDEVGATVLGTVAVTNTKAAGGLIKGDLRLGEVRYQIVRQGAAEVPQLTGVHRKGQPLKPVGATVAEGPAPSNWKLDIRVRAPGRIFVSGMGLEAEWSTDMRVTGTARAPSVVGALRVVRGTYSFAGKRLDLDDTSEVTFDGPLLDPQLDIRATTTVEAVSATVAIAGRAQRPQISFTSTPALPQDEVLSRLLFGSSVTTLSPTEALQLAAALNSLRGSGGGFSPLGKLRSVAGFDRLRILGADQATGRGTSLAAGKYIAKNIYVEVVTDTKGFTATQLEVALSKALSVLSSTGSFGGSNVSVRYRKEY